MFRKFTLIYLIWRRRIPQVMHFSTKGEIELIQPVFGCVNKFILHYWLSYVKYGRTKTYTIRTLVDKDLIVLYSFCCESCFISSYFQEHRRA